MRLWNASTRRWTFAYVVFSPYKCRCSYPEPSFNESVAFGEAFPIAVAGKKGQQLENRFWAAGSGAKTN